MEGYGIHHKIHTASVLRLGTDLPVIVQAVDKEEKIRNLIPELKEMLPTELMVVQEVEVVSGEGFEKE
jgi:PII-like signaling protein